MKKEKENEKRRLTLHRETIRRLEDSQLLKHVLGGTSQRICPTTISGFEEGVSDGC
ncbi:MAG TPA: hypothetical protein VJ725_26455 [Thermoanaerobaculia bacterium]|nr:hypothetical protein [Thermoanaerobaculia bacterium]